MPVFSVFAAALEFDAAQSADVDQVRAALQMVWYPVQEDLHR